MFSILRIFIGEDVILFTDTVSIVLRFCVCVVLMESVANVSKERIESTFNVVIVVLIFMIFISI